MNKQTNYSIIWMHGLGADSNDMRGLAEQLPASLPIEHQFLDAPIRPVTINGGMPMPAWYDIVGFGLDAREDEAGILQSVEQINKAIDAEIQSGKDSRHIFLAGFSQGGAMALYAALCANKPLAGVISLSAYLPMHNKITVQQPLSLPLFLGSGRFDPVVMPEWTGLTARVLQEKGFKDLTWQQYDMEHSICMEEVQDMFLWLKQQILEVRPA